MKKIVLAASIAVSLLAGCDQQQRDGAMNKLKAFFNSVKPDELLLKGLKPGETTEAQILDQMGKPETERTFTDGSKRFEYPRGSAGTTTWFVDLDRNGRFVSATQMLTAENIARVRPGMTMDQVRRLPGKPTQIAEFPLKKERVWSWHWLEEGANRNAMFNVHFDPSGTVVTTSRSDTDAGPGGH
ncbi:putative lipoprotein [Candidatus Paraburkholderia calva]|nr:putative lipoprotein [Candidatus Paraburkholderia calva]